MTLGKFQSFFGSRVFKLSCNEEEQKIFYFLESFHEKPAVFSGYISKTLIDLLSLIFVLQQKPKCKV